MNNCSELLTIVELIGFALKDARHAVFDWYLSDERLHFSIGFPSAFGDGLKSMTNVLCSGDLAPFICRDNVEALQSSLYHLTQACDSNAGVAFKLIVSSRDPSGRWRWDIEVGSTLVALTDVAKDIEAQKADANHQDLRYRELVELAPDAIFVCCGKTLAMLNQAAGRLLRTSSATELLGRSITDFIHPDYRVRFLESLPRPGFDVLENAVAEQVWIGVDGSAFHAEIASSAMMYKGMPALQMVVRDITERKRAEELQLGQNRVLNMVATGVPLQDILNDISHLVEALCDGKSCRIMLRDSKEMMLDDTLSCDLEAARMAHSELAAPQIVVANVSCDARWNPLRETRDEHGIQACWSRPIFGKEQQLLGTAVLYSNDGCAPTEQERELLVISANLAGIAIDSRASEERMRHLAYYDGLTSLPNRFLFKEYLDLALCNARRHQRKFAVFFLDLDKFKQINDTLGHDTGDYVLREIAARLRKRLRKTDKIARMGGDEFYVLIENLNDASYVSDIAQKLLEEAARPVQTGQQKCLLSASIGISIYPDHGENAHSLLKNADSAMYLAKALGSNNFQLFQSGMEDKEREEKALHRFRDLMESSREMMR